jgi:hypothetical protein
MRQRNPRIATHIATDFFTRCFAPGETIALLLRRESSAKIVQIIVPRERALERRYLGWLSHENATGANIYVAANPLCPGSRKRTKDSIATIRHLYIDMDTDGETRLAALRTSDLLPIPTVVISTSPGKYQALWRVKGFSFEQQESTLRLLSATFGGDPACTDRNRVLRLPGYLNRKYDPAYPVTAEYLSTTVWKPNDFRLNNLTAELAEPHVNSPVMCERKRIGKQTNSEHDWAWVLQELAGEKDAIKLTDALALRRADKPNPRYYAQRTVDLASAWLWLMEDIPIADVVTMLESRRRFEIASALCSARAREISLTAQRMILRQKSA